jgi:hypothetical protein
VRCPRCGNENPGTNRFCGTCGASLLAASDTAVRSENTSSAPVRNSAASVSGVRDSAATATSAPHSPQRNAPPGSRDVTGITGPSFLGLNPPPSDARSGLGLQRDAHHGGASRNLDYLLDDEEEPKRSAGKIFLILIALALAVGFGYLRWRHEGLSSLWAAQKKPAVSPSVEESQPATNPPANAPDASAAAGGNPPGNAQPATASPTGTGAPDSSSAPTGTATTTSPASPDASAAKTPADKPTNSAPPPAADSTPADKPATDNPGPAADSAAPSEKPSETPPAPAPKAATKPRPVPKPSAAFDQVTEAEKYIYGRGGVRQDCDRGMRMLRPAAEQANPKAMISLGALYSTGVCAPRDLPTAYRWFALALRKQPDNQPLQENLQRLWAQMTQPERQLAVKLSQ